MNRICVHDRATLETFFRRNPLWNAYSLGDLDDAFWPHTTWYALAEDGEFQAVALMYSGLTLPTLLCMDDPHDPSRHKELLGTLLPLLPARFYAHLGCGLAEVLKDRYSLLSHGLHCKMVLTDRSRLPGQDDERAVALTRNDLLEVQAFYEAAYPGSWFEPQMLDTCQYLGLRLKGELASVAGVHVYSPTYRVAALGNIATVPTHRDKGCAKAVTGQLCRHLLGTVDHIGLNVKADNAAAIACYESLGFEIQGTYEEVMAQLV